MKARKQKRRKKAQNKRKVSVKDVDEAVVTEYNLLSLERLRESDRLHKEAMQLERKRKVNYIA
jgi:hypothetical protein